MYRTSQKGAVSLFIVIFSALLMVIVSVSFVTLMITNQKQTTNDDLSQSALGSARAGVEDAKRALLRYQTICQNDTTADNSECMAAASKLGDNTPATSCNTAVRSLYPGTDISKGVDIKQAANDTKYDQAYTCVKVSLNTPNYLGTLATDQSAIIPLVGVNGFSTVQIQWYSADDLKGIDGTKVDLTNSMTINPLQPLLKQSSWALNHPSIIRTQLMQFGSNFTLTDFDNSTSDQSNANTLFLFPQGITGVSNGFISPAVPFTSDARKTPTLSPTPITCTGNLSEGGYACTAQLTLPTPIGDGSPTTFLRLTGLYNPTHYSVTLLGTQFKAVQPEVDSTGRANDLFRRVADRVTLGNTNFPYPDATVEVTGNVCKDFVVTNKTSDYKNFCTP